jgi:hypothetical protein
MTKENLSSYIDESYFVKLQLSIDSMPPGPERDCEQGKLDRLLAKLDAMPGRIADQLAGVSDRNKIREVVRRELEHVTSELPGGKSVGN